MIDPARRGPAGAVRSGRAGAQGMGPKPEFPAVVPVPMTISGITDATEVAAGGYFTCAVLGSGSTECWGRNEYGQLGNGDATDSPLPAKVIGF